MNLRGRSTRPGYSDDLRGRSTRPEDYSDYLHERNRQKRACSTHHRREHQIDVQNRRKQLTKAVEYCRAHKCRGYAALKTGYFPLVKCGRTVNKYLDKKQDPSASSEYCSILTVEEERLLVKMFVMKAQAYQPFNRKHACKYVVSMLKLRNSVNKAVGGGRKFKKLSPAALRVLEKGVLTRHFWERFDACYKDKLRKKRKGLASLKRVQACSMQMAKSHIDSLATELVSAGIMKDGEMLEDGKWKGTIDGTRVFNHDETPQFINYGVDGTASNIYYCGKGEGCYGLIAENRECVTISPMVSLAGDIPICHVIFGSACIMGNMAPSEAVKSIKNLLVSNTENGFQTGKSCKSFYELFDKHLTRNNIERPVVVLTDGHSSRFDLDVLRYCAEKKILQFVSPPDTTGLLQPLDQINAKLHSAYRTAKDGLIASAHINKEAFMNILGEIWPTWASSETVVKCFKRCGITASLLDTELMQQDKFVSAALIREDLETNDTDTLPSEFIPETPQHVKHGTYDYWKFRSLAYERTLKSMIATPVDPAQLSMFTEVQKFPVKRKGKNFRITQVYGSLTGQQILEKRIEMEKEEQIKKTKLKEKADKSEKMKNDFKLCETECTCEQNDCIVKGFKKCSVCENVLKSQCSKAMCKIASNGKPNMITPAVDRTDKSNQRKKSKPAQGCQKNLVYETIYSASESDESDSQGDSKEDSHEDSLDHEGGDQNESFLIEVWKAVSPPVKESDIIGKWFCADYEGTLIIGRATIRWLQDEDGKVESLQLDCLKPRVGNNFTLESFPPGQEDIYNFKLHDIVGGPLACRVPKRKPGCWVFPDLEKANDFYKRVKNIDRAVLCQKLM